MNVTIHDKIKAIKFELFEQTKKVKESLETEYATYTMLGFEDNTLIYRFRPDLEYPEEVIDVFTIQQNPKNKDWMLTTIGGDYSYHILLELLKLIKILNDNKIKVLKKWY